MRTKDCPTPNAAIGLAIGLIACMATFQVSALEVRVSPHSPQGVTSLHTLEATHPGSAIRDAFDLGKKIDQAPSLSTDVAKDAASSHHAPTDSKNALAPLGELVRSVLDEYYTRPLNTRDHNAWSVLHWSIAYGVDANVSVGHPRGDQVAAIGWLCCNYPSAGKQIIELRHGRWDLSIAPGRQGHDAQFLAMLAQSRVSRDYVIRVGTGEHTIDDLIAYEKRTCRRGQESTFKLISLAYYEGTDATWKNYHGDAWSVDRLLADELKAPIGRYTSTCGGLHRLYAIHSAVECRRRDGLTISPLYHTAVQKTNEYQRRAFSLQNSDGSFSTAWLDNAELQGDATRRLTTSGHVLEWLAFSLDDEQLDDPRFEQAIEYVARLLEGHSYYDWHPGALGHALHALAIYEQRTTDAQAGQRSTPLAGQTADRHR